MYMDQIPANEAGEESQPKQGQRPFWRTHRQKGPVECLRRHRNTCHDENTYHDDVAQSAACRNEPRSAGFGATLPVENRTGAILPRFCRGKGAVLPVCVLGAVCLSGDCCQDVSVVPAEPELCDFV